MCVMHVCIILCVLEYTVGKARGRCLTLGVLLSHSLLNSLDLGSLTDGGAKLVVSKPSDPPVFALFLYTFFCTSIEVTGMCEVVPRFL